MKKLFQYGLRLAWIGGWLLSATAWAVTAQDLGVRLELIQWGIQVDAVVKGSRAEVSGLRPKDLVVRVEQETLKRPADFETFINQFAGGSRVQVVILRGTVPSPMTGLTLFLTLPDPISPTPQHRRELLTTVLKDIHLQQDDFYELTYRMAYQGVPVGKEILVGLSLAGNLSVPVLPTFMATHGTMTYDAEKTTVKELLDAVLPAERYTYEEAYGVVNLLPIGNAALGEVNPLNHRLPELTFEVGAVDKAVQILQSHLPGVLLGVDGAHDSRTTGRDTAMTLTASADGTPTPPHVLLPFKLSTPLILPAGSTLRQAINFLATACGASAWTGSVWYVYGLGPKKLNQVSISIGFWSPFSDPVRAGSRHP